MTLSQNMLLRAILALLLVLSTARNVLAQANCKDLFFGEELTASIGSEANLGLDRSAAISQGLRFALMGLVGARVIRLTDNYYNYKFKFFGNTQPDPTWKSAKSPDTIQDFLKFVLLKSSRSRSGKTITDPHLLDAQDLRHAFGNTGLAPERFKQILILIADNPQEAEQQYQRIKREFKEDIGRHSAWAAEYFHEAEPLENRVLGWIGYGVILADLLAAHLVQGSHGYLTAALELMPVFGGVGAALTFYSRIESRSFWRDIYSKGGKIQEGIPLQALRRLGMDESRYKEERFEQAFFQWERAVAGAQSAGRSRSEILEKETKALLLSVSYYKTAWGDTLEHILALNEELSPAEKSYLVRLLDQRLEKLQRLQEYLHDSPPGAETDAREVKLWNSLNSIVRINLNLVKNYRDAVKLNLASLKYLIRQQRLDIIAGEALTGNLLDNY